MQKVALITGGTSGLGLVLAEEFARHGYDLLLVARDVERLVFTAKMIEGTFHVQVLTYSKDLREEGAAEDVYGFCQEQGLAIEALVNNAGSGTYGPFCDTFIDDNEATVQLDIVSLIDLTYLFLHNMRERGHGFILNVASTAGFQPGPNMAVYYASKSFVLSFTQSIAVELEKTGIGVTCLCPGPMKTPMLEKSGLSRSRIEKSFKPMDPAYVAAVAYRGMVKKKVVIIPGRKNKFRAFCSRFFSLAEIRRMMAKITAPLPEKK